MRAGATSAAWWRARPMRSSTIRRSIARRHRRWPGAHLSGSAVHGAVRLRLGADLRHRRLGADGDLVPADVAVLSALALVGGGAARYQFPLHALHLDSAYQYAAGKGGSWKGRVQAKARMSTAGELRSGKGHRDENFPVASRLIDARHRGIILAFYEFVRVADDIADHATPRAGREARSARPAGSESARPGRRQSRKPCGCARRSPSAACRRAMRRTCSPRSAWT